MDQHLPLLLLAFYGTVRFCIKDSGNNKMGKKQRKNSKRMEKKKKIIFYAMFSYLRSHVKEDIYILAVGAIGLMGSMLFHDIHNNHEDIQSKFSQMVSYTKNISYGIEFLNEDCQNNIDNEHILQHINALRINLKNLIDLYFSLGKLVSLKTYCAMFKITMLADQLQKADVKVCNTPQLKSIDTSELDSNTNEFITQIKINQIKREGIISAIYEYFSHAQDEFYTHKDCIKYDSENGS